MNSILFIANNNIGNGLSGGDRIFLELARHWSKKLAITIIGGQETGKLLHQYSVKVKFIQTDGSDNSNILIHQLRRLIKIFPYIKSFHQYDYIYSVSDFYPDSIPAFIAKILFPKIIWIAGYYLNAPNPLSTQSPYNQTNQFIKGLFYFLSQIPIKILINLFSNIIFITSSPDKKYFPHKKIVVIRGGVDTANSKAYHLQNKYSPKIFQAVFMGRFHPQKGALVLIDIWKKVVNKIPYAKLAIIGNGDLENQIKLKIRENHLTKNIVLLGFLDGPKKEKIFRQSQIVVHPAIYDSGGMSAAEAMAWGLPGVSFDLEALKTYYPQGMVKVTCFDQQIFANEIVSLLNNPIYYKKISQKAVDLINKHWDWSAQANNTLQEIGL